MSKRALASMRTRKTLSALTRAAERWRAIRFTEFERRQIATVRQKLDAEYKAANDTRSASQQPRPATGISSSPRT